MTFSNHSDIIKRNPRIYFLNVMSIFSDDDKTSPTSENLSIPNIPASKEGFDWPTDIWYIERILFLYGGVMTAVGVFLFIVTRFAFFLLIPITIGTLQGIFAITGFSILVKILLTIGFRQRPSI